MGGTQVINRSGKWSALTCLRKYTVCKMGLRKSAFKELNVKIRNLNLFI